MTCRRDRAYIRETPIVYNCSGKVASVDVDDDLL